SHTPPGGSPHIKPTRLLTTSCPGTPSAVLGVVYFAIIANSTVAAPIVAYFIAGPRIERRLERLRHWIQDRHQALMALTLAIAGIAVVLYGLA
ncbi:GAP family protein, partial [Mycobacterium alsense]|uniref:GAP family protein n=1 Tax=Mycobacterium alsense TaxID=324058 RepID=UPI001A973039